MLCRFDSPEWLGGLLMDSLGAPAPSSILDLGCGGGALSLAALSRWPSGRLVTVDVDAGTAGELRRALVRHPGVSHRHVVADVLQSSFDGFHDLAAGTVDLVISNPPYRNAKWTSAMVPILERAGLPRPSSVGGEVPVDLVFLAQALHLVRPNGSVGLILPDSMITGRAMTQFRDALLTSHSVRRVIQLPRRAFRNTDAQAYIVVVERSGRSGPVRLDRVAADGSWQAPVHVTGKQAALRLDHSYHCTPPGWARSGRTSLQDLGVQIQRGDLSSSEIRRAGEPTFHTVNFPRSGNAVSLGGAAPSAEGVWAWPGDLLIARIDRNLERKIAEVTAGYARLSDCVFRLRCPVGMTRRVLDGLISHGGQEQLTAYARGTGPRHISMRSLLDVRV